MEWSPLQRAVSRINRRCRTSPVPLSWIKGCAVRKMRFNTLSRHSVCSRAYVPRETGTIMFGDVSGLTMKRFNQRSTPNALATAVSYQVAADHDVTVRKEPTFPPPPILEPA